MTLIFVSVPPCEMPEEVKLRPADGKIVDTCDLSLDALAALQLYGGGGECMAVVVMIVAVDLFVL